MPQNYVPHDVIWVSQIYPFIHTSLPSSKHSMSTLHYSPFSLCTINICNPDKQIRKQFSHFPVNQQNYRKNISLHRRVMATGFVQEVIPTPLTSTSEQPPLFDGTTRLYISLTCPFAARAWITRNYKGLQDEIKLVPLNLQDRPAWYKEKVYPENKVPSLEHNNKIIGESLDIIKYIDTHFGGPSLFPDDPAKREFGEHLLAYTDKFNGAIFTSFKGDDAIKEVVAQFDYLENALHKFDVGPFFLGQFSLVDIAYIPFVERFQIFVQSIWKYDITTGRPKLEAWIEEVNKIDAYKPTKSDPEFIINHFSKILAQK